MMKKIFSNGMDCLVFFASMNEVFLLDPFCTENRITSIITKSYSGAIGITIDAHPTKTRGRYRERNYFPDGNLAYALAYGILEFYLEVIRGNI